MKYVRYLLMLTLAGALLGACKGEEKPQVTEEIAVSPASIPAGKALATYTVNVTSNVRWTVTMTEEGGGNVSWATLGRTSGTGDASVTVRVNENKYKEERRAVIAFKTAGGKTASVSLVQEGNSESSETSTEAKLRLGSYNLRRSGLTEEDNNNKWSIRKDRLATSIANCAFDIVGFQEVDTEQQNWLRDVFGPQDYAFYFFSPYAQNGVGSRGQGVGYRASMFVLEESHFFWASNDPDTMSSSDTGSSGNFNRGGCCVVLRHKSTGLKIFFMDNHGCLNSGPNQQFAHVYVDREKMYNPDGLPSVFVGDMNAGESSETGSVYMTYTSHWKDSYKELPAADRSGYAGTYNGYSYPTGKSRIDYIFIRGAVTPTHYTCDNTLYGGYYPSDHFPIYLDCVIKN